MREQKPLEITNSPFSGNKAARPIVSMIYPKSKTGKAESFMRKLVCILTLLCALALPALAEPLAGGWQVAESAEVTEDALEAFSIAAEALDGVAYEPIALLGTQVVAGMNYCILCRAWPATPDAQVGFVLAYVYADLEGNATFTHFAQIDIAALAQGE